MQIYENYYITPCGKVYSYRLRRFVKTHLNDDGYVIACINKKAMRVHRLVAMCYLDNPNNYEEVNHKDENKQHNSISNLEWCDHEYNQNYSNGKKIIDKETGLVYDSFRKAAREMGISRSTIKRKLGIRYFYI